MEHIPPWIIVVIAEGGILIAVVLGVFLWKARRVQRHLRAEMEALRRTQKTHADIEDRSPPESVLKAESGPDDDSTVSSLTTLLQTDENTEKMVVQLQEKNATLQRQLDTLQMHLEQAKMNEQKAMQLQRLLHDARGELTVLQRMNVQIKQQLHQRTYLLKKCVDEMALSKRRSKLLQEKKQECQALRQEIQQLKNTLAQYKAELRHPLCNPAECVPVARLKTKLARHKSALRQLQQAYNTLLLQYQQLLQNSQKGPVTR